MGTSWVADREHEAYLAVCDCTGHGMSAALMTVLAREKLWQAMNKASGPAHLLTRLDEKFRAAMMNGDTHRMRAIGMGLDLTVLAYSHKQRQVRFAGAKRPLWLVRDGKLLEFKGTHVQSVGPTGGSSRSWRPRCRSVRATSFMFWTGCPTSLADPRTKVEAERPSTLVLTLATMPPEDQHEFIQTWLQSWQGASPSTDDQLMISFRIPAFEG